MFLIDKLKQFTTHLLSAIQKQLKKTLQSEKLKQLSSIIPTLGLNRFNYRHVGLLLGLVAVIMLVGLGLNKISSTGIEPEVSAHSGKSTDIEESVGIAKLAAAKAALQAKRYTLSITLFEEILAGQPSMRNQVVKFYAKALEEQAYELVENNPDQAKELLFKALEFNPGNISGLSRLGYIYVDQKNYPKAIETYQKVAELAPRMPDAFFNLGYVYTITEKYQQAKDMYSRVVELQPSFTDEALFNLAVIHQKLGDHEQTIKSLERAVVLNPDNESAQNYLQKLRLSSQVKTANRK